MTKSRKSLRVPRTLSFVAQKGHCYYCRQPMWENDPSVFIAKHRISTRQAKLLRCTGEHLLAHKDGGTSEKNNIVAACYFCNTRRHMRRKDILPDQYLKLARSRLGSGRWHGLILSH